jgi:hypothetical protein
LKCFNCQGTGFSSDYVEEYKKKGYTKDMDTDEDGYNILKCRDCKGTGVIYECPLFYEVIDTYNGSRHEGFGIMARVNTAKEAEALKASIDGRWDGCEGSLKIKIKAIYNKAFGLERVKHYLCKHNWVNRILQADIPDRYVCTKCHGITLVRNHKNGKLPAYEGIGYWDEEAKCLVVPKKKQWITVGELKK